jgi:hypothetical protein
MREICANNGRVVTYGNSPKHDELVKLGCLTSAPLNISEVLYEATELGRQLAAVPLQPGSTRH